MGEVVRYISAQGRLESVDPCGRCGARPLGVCADLSARELECMADRSQIVRFEAGQTLVHEGQPNRNVFSLTTGSVKLYRLLSDGRRQITGFLHMGDFLGLGACCVAPFTAQALTAVQACLFRRVDFDRLLTDLPALEHRLVAIAGDELMAAQEQMLLLGRKTARERLASFLLDLAARQKRRGEPADPVRLSMTRLDIADYLGLTIETVSRTLSGFRAGGLVRLIALDEVLLLKPEALRALAQGAT